MDKPNERVAPLARRDPETFNNTGAKSLPKANGKSKARLPRVTKCPPGEALGARDLAEWATSRRGGRSGLPCAESPHAKAKSYSAHLEMIADRILRAGRRRVS